MLECIRKGLTRIEDIFLLILMPTRKEKSHRKPVPPIHRKYYPPQAHHQIYRGGGRIHKPIQWTHIGADRSGTVT